MALALATCMVVSIVPIFGEINGSKNVDTTKVTAQVTKAPASGCI